MSKRGSRRWVLTLNNYTEAEVKMIREKFEELNPKIVKRCQIGFEVGEEKGTPHLQGFVHFENSKTRSAMDKWFFGKDGRWDDSQIAKGTDFECWNYTMKDGDLLISYGEEPREEGELNVWEKIVVHIDEGMTTEDIVRLYPETAMRCIKAIYTYRLNIDRRAAGWRDLEVVYIHGDTGSGKTRYVMETHGYNNVFRVLETGSGKFDGYCGQDVLLFDEFRSTFKIGDMLNWLDGYPLELPARYSNRMAKFTKVYIISNWTFEMQYAEARANMTPTYKAFLRRIGDIWHDFEWDPSKGGEEE